jgi:hypothetical protein
LLAPDADGLPPLEIILQEYLAAKNGLGKKLEQ